MTDYNALLDTLRASLGAQHVLQSDAGPQHPGTNLQAWEEDWRRRARGKALAVVRPANTQEVAHVVRACAQAHVSIVPQGGNTGMVLGSIPDASGTQIVLSLQRMQAIRQIDSANASITAEAGCVLQNLQQACTQAGWLFALRMASQASCTLGGNLATNAGGTQVLLYGTTRELCLGLEVVTAQGEVWNGLQGLRKDNTGYDLRHLFIGSEGTLGIITAASMKLHPLPVAQCTALVSTPSLEAALALLRLAQRHIPAGLSACEVMGRVALGLVAQHFPQHAQPFANSSAWAYCVLLENSDFVSEAQARAMLEQVLAQAIAQGCALDAVVAQTNTQAHALWQLRESIPLAQAREGLNVKHDIALPVSRIPEFVHSAETLLHSHFPGVRIVNYGHLGDGNLHYNVQAPAGSDAARFLQEHEAAIHTLVYDTVARYQGSISAEHGIGSLKRDMLTHYKSPVALQLMRAIKTAWDPHALMNPGRVLPP